MTDTATEMKVDPARAQALISQLTSVRDRITAVSAGRAVRIPTRLMIA